MQSLFNTQHYFSIIIYKWQDVCYAYLFLMYMVSGCTGPSIKSSSTPWRHHWWLQTSSASHSPLKAFIGSGGVIMPAPDICSCMALVWSAAVNKEDGKLNILIYPSKRRNLAFHPYNENFQSPVFIFFFFLMIWLDHFVIQTYNYPGPVWECINFLIQKHSENTMRLN